jgi:hypothetical protein
MSKPVVVRLEYVEYRSPGMSWDKSLVRVRTDREAWREARQTGVAGYRRSTEWLLRHGYRVLRRDAGRGSVRKSREWWGLVSVFGEPGHSYANTDLAVIERGLEESLTQQSLQPVAP